MATPKPCGRLLGALSTALLCAGLLALLAAPPGACAARTLQDLGGIGGFDSTAILQDVMGIVKQYGGGGGGQPQAPSQAQPQQRQSWQQPQAQPQQPPQQSWQQPQGQPQPQQQSWQQPQAQPPPPQQQQQQPQQQPQQSGQAGSGVGDADLQRVLDMHNAFRAKHRAGALSWSGELQSSAQAWAERCVFEHSNSGVGENLAQGFGDWASAVQAWYDEAGQYDYGAATFSHGTGHFSQIVWVGTTSLGCGAARGCGGGPLYVCQYAPPGNVLGQFGDNVFPAQS